MLIGLYGYSRVGKDSIAGVLVKNHGFEQRNMAGAIREVLLKIDPYVIENYGGNSYYTLSSQVEEFGWDWVKAEYPESVDYMIALGQGMRDIDEDIWLNACVSASYENLVLADIRQPNEYEYITSRGGEMWRIERVGSQKRGMDGLLDDYEFDFEIKNDGTLEELESLVAIIMESR